MARFIFLLHSYICSVVFSSLWGDFHLTASNTPGCFKWHDEWSLIFWLVLSSEEDYCLSWMGSWLLVSNVFVCWRGAQDKKRSGKCMCVCLHACVYVCCWKRHTVYISADLCSIFSETAAGRCSTGFNLGANNIGENYCLLNAFTCYHTLWQV